MMIIMARPVNTDQRQGVSKWAADHHTLVALGFLLQSLVLFAVLLYLLP